MFNCLQTTTSPEGISLVRSCRCGDDAVSNNPATWTVDQVREGVILPDTDCTWIGPAGRLLILPWMLLCAAVG